MKSSQLCSSSTVVCKQALFEGKLRYGKQGSARCRAAASLAASRGGGTYTDDYIFLVPIGRARLIGIQFFGTDRTGASNRYGGENLKLFSGLFSFLLR